ncbi:glutamate 5-kinase [Luminiphilus syltensis NOR5-1B]|uniref:Glutamate 5-kinase n=1 Tax=Luminiphilus syltensis NOR5-1B TaxID=565045 RepID=B8KWL2_9GAMM|nr:glutamate 5-kinase [Luminiphilus syltensis NOR5-1B]
MSAKRWVIKIGSALLTDDGKRLDRDIIDSLTTQIAQLLGGGIEVVLVSSGAVAAGVVRLGMSERPHDLHDLQAAAAVGQSALVRAYEDALQPKGVLSAQILLSHADILARDRYLNARATLKTLLAMGVLPIVNENDTVVTDEIRLGDNDTLAALVANLVDADALLILTDQSGLYDRNPSIDSDARLIDHASVSDASLDGMVGEGGTLGRGGMVTKLRAARLAARSGTMTVIASGKEANVIERIRSGETIGTLLHTDRRPESARKQWLASLLHAKGALILDDGAVRGVVQQGRSLLPVGVTGVEGRFDRGDLVRCLNLEGREVARGLINYPDQEARQLIGVISSDIESRIGYGGDVEMIHRDNLITVGS